MTDKRYPTRMHEVLGVETGQVFYFEGANGLYQEYVLDGKGHLFRNHKTQRIESPRMMADIINHPERIVRKPRPSEEQVAQLRACIEWFDLKWLAKQEGGTVMAFESKPHKKAIWFVGEGYEAEDYGWVVKENSPICSLVSWSDPEPLDIVATLKANDVEVEG